MLLRRNYAMTAQIRTEFYFNGTRYFLIDSEFDKYLLDQTVFTIPIDFDHEGVCTANWKGYYVTYFLENRSLYGVLHEFLNDEDLKMATVKTPMKEEEKAKPGNVKVITDKNGYALYFSRSLIPYPREDTGVVVYKHIGIYGYRRDFLLQYAKMQPTPLEQTESLEQLRALENGYKIKVIATDKHFVGVDTKEDLEEVNKIYQEMEKNK